MTPLTIHTIWLVLIIVAATTCFSLFLLSFGLFISSWRQEREDAKRNKEDEKNSHSDKQRLPDIMGQSKKIVRQKMPILANNRQTETSVKKQATFANEIPGEELDKVFGEEDDNRDDPDMDFDLQEGEVDLQDEELDFLAYRAYSDNEFATGTTFEELDKTSNLLRKDNLEAVEQKTVVEIALRLAQTDLWNIITQAIPQANEKIAKMLDTPFRTEKPEDWKSFDIRDFI